MKRPVFQADPAMEQIILLKKFIFAIVGLIVELHQRLRLQQQASDYRKVQAHSLVRSQPLSFSDGRQGHQHLETVFLTAVTRRSEEHLERSIWVLEGKGSGGAYALVYYDLACHSICIKIVFQA